jgi:hypothetical protein
VGSVDHEGWVGMGPVFSDLGDVLGNVVGAVKNVSGRDMMKGVSKCDSRVVGSTASSSKDDVYILVSVRLDNSSHSILGHSHETMSMLGTAHSIDRDSRTPVSPVLESDRERNTGSELSM